MKVLHCTDLHFNQHALNWISSVSHDYDLICLTGDFLDTSDSASLSLEEQTHAYHQWFETLGEKLFVCSGNHDFIEQDLSWLSPKGAQRWQGDNSKTHKNDVTIGCIGYNNHQFDDFNDCQLLLVHEPPQKTSVAKQAGQDFGSALLHQALKSQVIAPQYLLCGHVHQPKKHLIRFKQTIISNPGGIHKNAQASYCSLNL